ncbi:hypothetical protein [Pseudomonas sp. 7SR1]|nr:hypothetical protein [Pseudomonas sp. 7SR1]SIS26475.1 hypothetical protein SAMN05428955_4446 [Pseudomonas sp. 7SR1]
MLHKTFIAALCASTVLTFATVATAAQTQSLKSEEGTLEVTTARPTGT